MRFVTLFLPVISMALLAQETGRPRARDAGIVVGILPTGPLNAITDVPGVAIGQKTIVEGDTGLEYFCGLLRVDEDLAHDCSIKEKAATVT